ncbi:hypothetical protein B296_00018652 [Ensete ventricosum]|uniref:Uncharacterized protein n=1 Tax=Ensete ventricosum TaxID=4639 RepID=A0A427AQ81_ENSVE|nr:hypothetical protein B296_00018652 [Ensete ventricosum]
MYRLVALFSCDLVCLIRILMMPRRRVLAGSDARSLIPGFYAGSNAGLRDVATPQDGGSVGHSRGVRDLQRGLYRGVRLTRPLRRLSQCVEVEIPIGTLKVLSSFREKWSRVQEKIPPVGYNGGYLYCGAEGGCSAMFNGCGTFVLTAGTTLRWAAFSLVSRVLIDEADDRCRHNRHSLRPDVSELSGCRGGCPRGLRADMLRLVGQDDVVLGLVREKLRGGLCCGAVVRTGVCLLYCGCGDFTRSDIVVGLESWIRGAVYGREHIVAGRGRVPFKSVGTESLSELVGAKNSLESVGTISPLELIGTESPLELVGTESPLELVGTESLLELVGTEGPLESVGIKSSLELVGTECPLELVGIESPLESIEIKSLLELIRIESPLELIGTESPLELTRIESPLELRSMLRVGRGGPWAL